MEMTEKTERTLDPLRKLLALRSFEQLEAAWIEASENAQFLRERLPEFLDIAEALLREPKETGRAGALLEVLGPSITDAVPPQDALRYYALLVRSFPNKKEYRAAYSERFERLHPLASAERVFYEACGFASSTNPIVALTRLERLFRFREGAYVYHASGWGVGKVTSVDPFLRQIKVDLEHKRDHRIAIDAVDSILEPLEPDSFRALRHEGGDALRRLRDEDPIRLLHLVCDAFGSSLQLKEVKAHLVPVVVEAPGWSRWWNRAKSLLRDTGLFRVGDRAPYLIERLQRAVSYEEELMATFKKADWVRARPIARQVARRTGGELASAWALIRERLITLAAGSDRATAIEAALILDRGDGSQSHEALVQIFSSLPTQDLVNSLQALPGADDQRRAVESLSVTRPNDWQDVASLLFMGKKDALRTAALDVLEDLAPEKAVSLLRDLVKAPAAAPETFCFVLEGFLEGSKRPCLELFRHRGARGLLVLVMDLLDHLQHRSQRVGRVAFKEMIGRVESILALGHNRLFIEGAKAMEQDELLDLHARLVKNDSLTPQIKGAILEALRTIEPSLGRALDVLPSDEDAIYVLPEGLEKKKTEFREIMEVKLQKVIEDIGRARDFGDLSENAEYTAALEERDHLTKRATKMKADLDKVKLITPDMVETGKAGLGSRIRLKNLRTGEEVVYSVLGPWDGGPQDGVLSYLSPLGLLFQGKKAGDEVDAQLPGGMEKFRLLDVASHFEH